MPNLIKTPVVVLGAGSWGTALAAAAARACPTVLWGRDPVLMQSMRQHRQNTKYLPDVLLPEALQYSSDFEELVQTTLSSSVAPLFVLASPVAGFAALCERLSKQLRQHTKTVHIVWTCKGFESTHAFLPHQSAAPFFDDLAHVHTGALSGPSFAKEVAQGLPVALTVASVDAELRAQTINVFHGGMMRVYGSEDLVGVEVGGALKNVLALACGVSDGLGLGTNARAALLTRGLAEMIRLGTELGAKQETFYGLTGLGDLILTATGDLSRNRRVGLALGKGQLLADILSATPHVAEGVNCARVVQGLARQYKVSMPITEAVCSVLFEAVAPKQAVLNLLSRDPQSLEFIK